MTREQRIAALRAKHGKQPLSTEDSVKETSLSKQHGGDATKQNAKRTRDEHSDDDENDETSEVVDADGDIIEEVIEPYLLSLFLDRMCQ